MDGCLNPLQNRYFQGVEKCCFLDSFADFIAMGGYGFYVWLTFGSCALILLGILVSSLNDTKRIFSSVKQQAQREERIKKAKQEAGQ